MRTFTYYTLKLIDFECYSFLVILKKSPYKEIWPLSTFWNISVTEAYILKCDILVIVLFSMFSSNNK